MTVVDLKAPCVRDLFPPPAPLRRGHFSPRASRAAQSVRV